MRPWVPLLLICFGCSSAPAKPEPVQKPEDPGIERVERALAAHQQICRVEAEERYRTALAMKSRQDLEGAFRECKRAVEIYPEHREARALFRDLADLLGYPGPLQADRAMDLMEVRRRETMIEIENALSQGDRLAAAKEYDRALEEFERAQILVLSVPDENLKGQLALSIRRRISEIKQSR